MEIKIKKLNEFATIPQYAHDTDACFDLVATSINYDFDKDYYVYGTGLAMEIPEGYVGLVFPRSSNRKTNAYMCNHVGVIDAGYRGEIMVSFKNRDEITEGAPYEIKDRVAQMMIIPFPKCEFTIVDELSETERGEGGHGSTGK